MRFSTAFRSVLKARKTTQAKLAEMVPSPTKDGEHVSTAAVAGMLKKDNPSMNALLPYLEKLGYDIALVPTGTAAMLPDGSFIIDGRD